MASASKGDKADRDRGQGADEQGHGRDVAADAFGSGLTEAQAGLRRQFLEWLAERPRAYDDVMAAWRTSCPRLTIWEDAVGDGLIAFDGRLIMLSEKGRAAFAVVQL